MSSYFDEASLVMIPSGYKNQKVYSVKPLDGSGDLTFSRASSATRVASNGLIEKVRTNLLTYSQDFTNAAWLVDAGLTKTLGQTDPNGGTTAALFSGTSGSNLTVGHAVNLTANVPNTISIWIKGASSGSVSLRIDDSGTGPQYDINYTTSWQRFSVTKTVNQSSCTFVVGGYFTWGVGENIYLAFGQAETGDIATDYIATTSAAVSVGPVSGLPRLDYLNSTCPRLLLEPQRTNVTAYSEQLDNAIWAKANLTATTNAIVSPDGYTNADKIVDEINGSGNHLVSYTIGTAGTTYTWSAFMKKAEYNYGQLHAYDKAGAIFDLNAGTVVSSDGISATITNYGNGWYRCTYTFTALNQGVFVNPSKTSTSAYAYSGTIGSGIYIWGCQLEAGAYATSYIPTLGTSVTRVADAASKTGISSLIGQAEGTVYFEIQLPNPSAEGGRVLMQIGSGSDRIYFAKDSSTQNIFQLATQSSAGYNFINTANVTTSTVKMAIAYKSGQNAFYLNGTLISTASATANPTSISQIVFGDPTFGNSQTIVKQALLFKTRLTNSQLAELTSL